jgi:hypothetical protein
MKTALQGVGVAAGVVVGERWRGPAQAFRAAWRLGDRAYGRDRLSRR